MTGVQPPKKFNYVLFVDPTFPKLKSKAGVAEPGLPYGPRIPMFFWGAGPLLLNFELNLFKQHN